MSRERWEGGGIVRKLLFVDVVDKWIIIKLVLLNKTTNGLHEQKKLEEGGGVWGGGCFSESCCLLM